MIRPLLCFFLVYGICDAQNLVPNPGFEEYIGCPTSMAQFDSVRFWTNASNGTPDYFNSCSPGLVNVPNSLYGYQPAHSGNARTGILLFAKTLANRREYIEVALIEPLQASQCYFFEMYVSLADNFKYSTNALGVYFSASAVDVADNHVLPFVPQLENTTGYFDTLNWQQVTGSYVATGGETHILIGNFKDDAHTDTSFVNATGTFTQAYIYLDDIQLTPCSSVATAAMTTQNMPVVYPIPTNGTLIVQMPDQDPAEFTLSDNTGRKVMQRAFTGSASIDLQSLPGGIFLYEVRTKKGLAKKGTLAKE